MAISYNKKELEKRKQTKKVEKQKRKDERKASGGSGSFEDMIMYVDEYGMLTEAPPDPTKKVKIETESIQISTAKKEETEEAKLKGRVEYFNKEKGYGFIKDSSSVEKYFFHFSKAPSNIAEGHVVIYELERGQRGMNATNIEIDK